MEMAGKQFFPFMEMAGKQFFPFMEMVLEVVRAKINGYIKS
jgi:hypothetical protein